MTGFTAINASPAQAPPATAMPVSNDPKSVQQKPKRRQPARKSAASSNETPQMSESMPTADSSTKRISGQGRKRKVSLNDNPEPKRRKNGRVQSNMSTTKPGVIATETPDAPSKLDEPSDSSTDLGGLSAISKAKLDGFRYNAKPATAGDAIRPEMPQSSSQVYTPQTPTSISQQSQLQTTMQAVRNSSRGGSLLYSSSATLPYPDTGTQTMRPSFSSKTLPYPDTGTQTMRPSFSSTTLPYPDTGTQAMRPSLSSTTLPYPDTSTQTIRPLFSSSPLPRTPLPRTANTRRHSSQVQTPAPANSDPLVQSCTNTLLPGKVPAIDSSKTWAPSPPLEPDDEFGSFEFFEHTPPIGQRGELFHKHRDTSDGDYDDYLDEDELIELAKRVEKSTTSRTAPLSREWKLNIREVKSNEDYGGALFTEEERRLLDTIKPPPDTRKPIVRTPFPSRILDRTSLSGVSNTTVLRTCFRVGEALNTGCQAVRCNQNVILELYARVTSSWREAKPSRKQHFIINDLYHDRPPFISGTFELWDQSTLWEEDSRPFLHAGADGMLCRTIARMKRDGTKWRLEILNVWQADWEDVEHVAEIYAKHSEVEEEDESSHVE